jgi:hypothetical protein
VKRRFKVGLALATVEDVSDMPSHLSVELVVRGGIFVVGEDGELRQDDVRVRYVVPRPGDEETDPHVAAVLMAVDRATALLAHESSDPDLVRRAAAFEEATCGAYGEDGRLKVRDIS